MKRIIAFSTVSQLGYMFMAIGLSQYNVALFHMVNHAFFKSLLFLAAGAVIHSMADQQDISIFFGFVFSDLFVGIGTDFFGNSIFTHPTNITLVEAEFSLPLLLKLLPTIGSIFAAISAIILYNYIPNVLIDLTDSPSSLTNSTLLY